MPSPAKNLWFGASLIVGLMAAVAVGGVGFLAYQNASLAAENAEQRESTGLLSALRREVISEGQVSGPAFESILSHLQRSGVSFIALLGPEGRPVVSAGRPAAAIGRLEVPAGERVRVDRVGEQLRALQRAVPATGAHPAEGPCVDLACKIRRTLSEQSLLVEFAPPAILAWTDRARITAWVAAGAGLLLASLALGCWLMARRALG